MILAGLIEMKRAFLIRTKFLPEQCDRSSHPMEILVIDWAFFILQTPNNADDE
jgi:hypothetical protein